MNPEQQSALAIDHHVVVHANAGAGKTHVLVERFIAIVLSGKVDRIEQIVATTFTIKAAAEMRSRIRTRLLGLSEAEENSQTRARLLEFADNIGSARITTLHSFCASLLRKYASGSGVDVDAQELSQRRSSQWRTDAMRATINAWLQDDTAPSSRRVRLLSFLDELDVYSAELTLHSLIDSTERREHLAAILDNGDEVVIETWMMHIHNAARDLALTLMELTLDDLRRLHQDCGANVGHLIADLAIAHEALYEAAPESVLESVRNVYKQLEVFYTKDGTGRKKSKPFDECSELTSLSKSQWSTLAEYSNATSIDVTRQLTLVHTALDLATDAAIAYRRMKQERNAIDFDDMMDLTRTMLQKTDNRIAEDVRRGIRYLMVDEFQDTNAVQYDIIQTLIPDLLSGPHSVNLFIVGDAKQSIYRFRGADVRLFLQATQDIVQANRRRGLPDGHVVLSTSYRMSPNLLPLVNGICEPMFRGNATGIEYTPLTGGRQDEAAMRSGTSTVLRTNTGAAVDMDGEDTKGLPIEMRHVAQHLVRVLSTTISNPGDIAVLVRTVDGVTAAGVALREAGIPFQTHSGRAFFSRPEVADIRNLLQWSTDTDDDLAFCALARSPLVLLHDADLVRIAATPTRGSMWKRFTALVPPTMVDSISGDIVDSTHDEALVSAYERLRDWSIAVRVLPATTFVNRALESSGWHATLANDPRRSQILLNVEKVIELILSEQDASNASVRDIILALTPPASDREADSRFAADPNAVQVMTLHAAKGLEFPVVVLANIAKRTRGDANGWSDEIGLTFTPPAKLFTFAAPQGEAAPSDLLHLTNRKLGEGAGAEEDMRLLYVGLTRAKDHLVLSMPYATNKGGDERKSTGLAALMQDTLWELASSVIEYDGQVEQYTPTLHQSAVVDASAPLTTASWLEIVTATELLSHAVEEVAGNNAESLHEGMRADHGPAYGTLMHDILQHVITANAITSQNRASVIDAVLATRLVDANALTLARTEITHVLDSTFVRTHATLLNHAEVETTLIASLDSTVLQGMMDVRFESDSSTMEVWDWKTNIVKHESDIASLASAYHAQAQAYAWLCLKAFPQIQNVRTRLLFTKAVSAFPNSWVSTQEWSREAMSDMEANIVDAVHALVERRRRRSG